MLVLDTDVMIDLLRQHPPAVAWLASLGDEELVLPGFVVMELIQGCRNKSEQTRVETTLRDYAIAWPTEETCEVALASFSTYHLSHNLGLLDALIAHTAVALNAPLCTFNQKHYTAIQILSTIQLYAR